MSGTVRQIQVVSDPHTPYYLQVDWTKDLGAGFTLALSDGISAWIGEVSEDEVIKEAKAKRVSRENYLEDLHRALTGREADGVGQKEIYSFHLSLNHNRLSYMKTSKGNLVTVGSTELQPAPGPVELNRELISHALERSIDLESQNQKLQNENQRLRQKHKQLLTELGRHVQDKDSMEREMYSRFVMVLNEKKAKIRGLQGSVKQLLQIKDQRRHDEGFEESDEAKAEGGDTSHREEPSQSVHLSQAQTVLITGRSQPNLDSFRGDSVFESTDILHAQEHRLHHPQSPQ